MTRPADSNSPVRPVRKWTRVAARCAALSLALGVVAVGLAAPAHRLNAHDFVLVLIALLILLYPDLGSEVKRLRKFKAGPVELELDPVVKHLQESIRNVERSLEGKNENFGFPPITETSAEARRLLDKGELKAAFLVLVVEVEQRIRELADMNQLRARLPLRALADMLVERGILPKGVVDIFNQVWSVRNQIVHGIGGELSDNRLRDLVQVAQRLHHMVHYIPC